MVLPLRSALTRQLPSVLQTSHLPLKRYYIGLRQLILLVKTPAMNRTGLPGVQSGMLGALCLPLRHEIKYRQRFSRQDIRLS